MNSRANPSPPPSKSRPRMASNRCRSARISRAEDTKTAAGHWLSNSEANGQVSCRGCHGCRKKAGLPAVELLENSWRCGKCLEHKIIAESHLNGDLRWKNEEWQEAEKGCQFRFQRKCSRAENGPSMIRKGCFLWGHAGDSFPKISSLMRACSLVSSWALPDGRVGLYRIQAGKKRGKWIIHDKIECVNLYDHDTSASHVAFPTVSSRSGYSKPQSSTNTCRCNLTVNAHLLHHSRPLKGTLW